MDLHGPNKFANPVSTIPYDVIVCNKIPCIKWVAKYVTLKNKEGMDVVNGVYQNIHPKLIIDMDGKSLGAN